MTGLPEDQRADERIRQWVETHGKALRGYLWAITGSHHDADELFQEVFHRAWRNRNQYTEQGRPLAYLLRIADRLAIDRSRKHSAQTMGEQPWRALEPRDDGEPPWEKLERQESARQLEVAMNELTEIQRRVLLLKYYGDLTFAEIAELIDCPLSTALSHARRGLQRLRSNLAPTQDPT